VVELIELFDSGIMLFVTISENFRPYQHMTTSHGVIEFKVANDAAVRPDINVLFLLWV